MTSSNCSRDFKACDSEFKAEICLKYLVLVHRIDSEVARSSRAQGVVDSPGIGVGEIKEHGVRQHVPGFDSHPLQV